MWKIALDFVQLRLVWPCGVTVVEASSMYNIQSLRALRSGYKITLDIWYECVALSNTSDWKEGQHDNTDSGSEPEGGGAYIRGPATVHAAGVTTEPLRPDEEGFPKSEQGIWDISSSPRGAQSFSFLTPVRLWESVPLKPSSRHLVITHRRLCERHVSSYTYIFLHFSGFFTKIRLSCIHVIN